MDVFVARQPIFDRDRQVYAYELLFRSGAEHNEFDGTESATLEVVANSLLSIGLDNMLDGKKGFVNFDRTSLMGGLHSILPPELIVIELLETIEPDEEVVAMCEQLRTQGYLLALDDFVNHPRFAPLTKIAHVIKIDFRVTPKSDQERLIETFRPRGIAMLAEKVETQEEFEWARHAGYDFFQGYFFAQPVVMRGQQIPGRKLTSLQLLSEMQHPDLDFQRIEMLIRQDVSLSFKLLRYANSAFYRRSGEVRSIEQALTILGEIGIRRWVVVAALPMLGQDKPGELIGLSLLRARFCERLAQIAGQTEHGLAFLLGLFSLLDALIDLPLDESLEQIKVAPAIASVLLDGSGEAALDRVYRLMKSYEAADWPAVKAVAASLRLEPSEVSSVYSESVLWSQQVLRGGSRLKDSRRRARHALRGTVRVLCADDEGAERILSAKLINVSVQGLQIELQVPVKERTRVHLNDVPLGISGRGVVRYCKPARGKYLAGLEFPDGTGWQEPFA